MTGVDAIAAVVLQQVDLVVVRSSRTETTVEQQLLVIAVNVQFMQARAVAAADQNAT